MTELKCADRAEAGIVSQQTKGLRIRRGLLAFLRLTLLCLLPAFPFMSLAISLSGDEVSANESVCQSPESAPLHVPSPDWREQIVYMLFIDRFNDGDPTNNDQGYGEYNPALETHFSGGDLRGLRDKLDYLKALGVTAVWVTPPVLNQWWSSPYEATGWHGYWAVDFKKVDPHFGTLDGLSVAIARASLPRHVPYSGHCRQPHR